MDADPHHDPEELEEARQSGGSILALAFGPSIWAVHFLIVYVAGAIACEKAPAAMWQVRVGIGAATAVALVAILLVSVPAWREWRRAGDVRTDRDTPTARSRFLGYAALLLSGLSVVAVVFSALPAALAGACS